MYSSYSPLFTLGLLAEPCPSSRSSPTSPVPVEEAPPASQKDDDASAIYFTLKTGKRDTVELRSFLYLDLADRKQHAPSHRRKFSILSKSTSWTCTADVKSIYDLVRTEPMITSPAPMAVPTRRRTSKESLRSIPSPKPAPSATLPDLPTPSPCSPSSSVPPSSFKKRSASTVVSSLLPPSPRARRPASSRSESISSHDRRRSRMDALACLEGRSRAPNRVPRSSLRNNFMSFSDDEDEKSTTRKSTAPSTATTSAIQIEDLSAFADVEDEVDIPPPPRKCEDRTKSARPEKLARKRRGTIESWFPLKSFIDFKDDDMSSWNWRSFIEIGGVS